MPVFFGIYEKSRQKLTSTIGMIDVGKVYVFGFFCHLTTFQVVVHIVS